MKYIEINTRVKGRKLTTEEKLNRRGVPSFRQMVRHLNKITA